MRARTATHGQTRRGPDCSPSDQKVARTVNPSPPARLGQVGDGDAQASAECDGFLNEGSGSPAGPCRLGASVRFLVMAGRAGVTVGGPGASPSGAGTWRPGPRDGRGRGSDGKPEAVAARQTVSGGSPAAWPPAAHTSPASSSAPLARKRVCSFYYCFTTRIWHAGPLHMLVRAY